MVKLDPETCKIELLDKSHEPIVDEPIYMLIHASAILSDASRMENKKERDIHIEDARRIIGMTTCKIAKERGYEIIGR